MLILRAKGVGYAWTLSLTGEFLTAASTGMYLHFLPFLLSLKCMHVC
jgi:hypothetical protein